jgi:hypothetical protein
VILPFFGGAKYNVTINNKVSLMLEDVIINKNILHINVKLVMVK